MRSLLRSRVLVCHAVLRDITKAEIESLLSWVGREGGAEGAGDKCSACITESSLKPGGGGGT